MSYRNDHDAALSRVDALEAELDAMRRKYERDVAEKPPQERTSRPRWIAGGLLAVMTVATGVGLAMLIRLALIDREAPPATAPAVADAPAILPSDVLALRECRDAIAPLTVKLTAETTDPHGAKMDTAPIVRTGAPCRRLLQTADSLGITPELRPLVAQWSLAEDELIGSITRTRVYYASDPYAADGYRSAQQLWKEYDRALTARDAVLRDLAPRL